MHLFDPAEVGLSFGVCGSLSLTLALFDGRALRATGPSHIVHSFHDSPATCDYISVCTGSQYPHSIRTVTAQYPHSIRTVSACENRGISANPRLYKRSSELRILLSTHAFAEIPLFSHADTVRILCGYCADTVRIL